jgi:hypothetical protein
MTPRITNRKLESIAKDLEKARGITSLARQRIMELCVGDTKASDAHRIRELMREAGLLSNCRETLGFAADAVLLQRKSEAAK